MSTIILRCTCDNSYQDSRYGIGWRLHNSNNETLVGLRKCCCTVCGNVKTKKETLKTKEWETEHSEWSK